MDIYQFIKYQEGTNLKLFLGPEENKTIICFDFEDSIQDCRNPLNTPDLKAHYRAVFKNIVTNSHLPKANLKLGVRINSADQSEYLADIEALVGIRNITTIFLPKLTGPEQVLDLEKRLCDKAIQYAEIIPVIESKTGISNLKMVLELKLPKIKNIAFGHCDYNLDNQIFPFFHQDSLEYWSWISKITDQLRPFHIGLVNSPFLQLANDYFFTEMLTTLASICGSNFGQITLSRKQTELCQAFRTDPQKAALKSIKISHRLDLKTPDHFASEFIDAFDQHYLLKGFAVTNDRVLLSPQEYTAAQNWIKSPTLPAVNFTFAGGCFPVQGDIMFEDLFHQQLKRKVEKKRPINLNVNIIRYERFANCKQKIADYQKANSIDILVFSIRPEPYLRLCKLVYKYQEAHSGRKKWGLNLPTWLQVLPEKHELLASRVRFHPPVPKDISRFRKALINLNYVVGALVGNHRFALDEYLKLLEEIKSYCKQHQIELVFLGTPLRTNTLAEKILSVKLEKASRTAGVISSDNFVPGADFGTEGNIFFKKNGIHATEKYHDLIARRLTGKLIWIIDKLLVREEVLPGE